MYCSCCDLISASVGLDWIVFSLWTQILGTDCLGTDYHLGSGAMKSINWVVIFITHHSQGASAQTLSSFLNQFSIIFAFHLKFECYATFSQLITIFCSCTVFRGIPVHIVAAVPEKPSEYGACLFVYIYIYIQCQMSWNAHIPLTVWRGWISDKTLYIWIL